MIQRATVAAWGSAKSLHNVPLLQIIRKFDCIKTTLIKMYFKKCRAHPSRGEFTCLAAPSRDRQTKTRNTTMACEHDSLSLPTSPKTCWLVSHLPASIIKGTQKQSEALNIQSRSLIHHQSAEILSFPFAHCFRTQHITQHTTKCCGVRENFRSFFVQK